MQNTFEPWNALPTPNIAADKHLPKESDRWEALLDSPSGFLGDVKRFGPLTIEGFLHARTSGRLEREDGWPSDPFSIARLAKACGMQSDDCGFIARGHINYLSGRDTPKAVQVIAIHRALLEALDITPSHKELLDLFAGTVIEDSNIEDYAQVFNLMLEYLPTAVEEELFLEEFLPYLERSYETYGARKSMGPALAYTFTRANPASIIEWCKLNDDQVGLGYLVWQERYSFSEWLQDVATASDLVLIRGSERTRSDNKNSRLNEQLDTLNLLAQRLPEHILVEQGAAFASKHPHLVDKLLMISEDPFEYDDHLKWCFGLLAAKVISKDHPVFEQWINKAQLEQEGFLRDGTLKLRDALSKRMHYMCGPISTELGLHASTLLARDMLFRINATELVPYLVGMPSIDWLKDTDITEVLDTYKLEGPKRFVEVALTMYPWLPINDRLRIALDIVDEYDVSHQIHINNAVRCWPNDDPVEEAVLNSRHNGLAWILHLVSKVDPQALFTSMESLDVNAKDPLYKDMVTAWLTKQMSPQTNEIELPINVGESVLGY